MSIDGISLCFLQPLTFRFDCYVPYRFGFCSTLALVLSISHYNHFITFVLYTGFKCRTAGSIVQKMPHKLQTAIQLSMQKFHSLNILWNIWMLLSDRNKRATIEKRKLKFWLANPSRFAFFLLELIPFYFVLLCKSTLLWRSMKIS